MHAQGSTLVAGHAARVGSLLLAVGVTGTHVSCSGLAPNSPREVQMPECPNRVLRMVRTSRIRLRVSRGFCAGRRFESLLPLRVVLPERLVGFSLSV